MQVLRTPHRLFVTLWAALCLWGSPDPLRAQDRTSKAIDDGIEYLLKTTESRLVDFDAKFKSGRPSPDQENGIGILALDIYALVVAGVSVEHPVVRAGFKFLDRIAFTHTYTTAIYAFGLDAAISQIESDLLMLRPPKVVQKLRDNPRIGAEYRPRLREAVEAIVKAQNKLGVWRYGPGAQDFDNSNVQFAVLALGVGAKRGANINDEVWLKVVDHFVKGQQKEGEEIADRLRLRPPEERGLPRDDVKLIPKDGPGSVAEKRSKKNAKDKGDGATVVVGPPIDVPDPVVGTEATPVYKRGWDYENKGQSTWNMSCAGLSSLLLARQNLKGKLSTSAQAALDKAVRDGYGWIMGNWQPTGQYYGIYSIEKVGDIGDVQLFGSHNWYEEISGHLLGSQQPDGSWPKGGGPKEEPEVATAFALLVLNRATSLLTQAQSSRIVISGKRSEVDTTDRSWVYVPELDTTLHYPSLLRAIRLRPSPRLFKFLESIVESYPEERKGDLVPDIVKVRRAMEQRGAQRALDQHLATIAGAKLKSLDDYAAWYELWQKVLAIGEGKKKEGKDELLKAYREAPESVTLRKTLMWSLNQIGAREAIPLLLDDMGNADPTVRLSAYNYFKAYFLDFPPPFDPSARADVREKQVATIREWSAKQK